VTKKNKKEITMNFIEKVFNWMVMIGLGLLVGRIITLVFRLMDIPFTTFFKDYNIISFIILIIGVIGSQMMKDKNK
jgi:ABC-type antimicrobial peptide transport system permease subunit